MIIDLDPSIHLGPLTLAWHGIFTAVGIFFGVWLSTKLVRKVGVSEADATAIATWGVVGGIIGARVFHVADCWTGCTGIAGGYSAHPELIPQIWSGGIAVWGAAIGGVLGGLIVALRRGVPIGAGADGAAPGISLGFAIGRIGDIINGEHHAVSCQPPAGICVEFTNPNTLGQSSLFPIGDPRYAPDLVHLVVAYDMLWNAIAVVWLLVLRGRGLPNGLLFWSWMAWYAVGRFALGYLRVGDPNYAFNLREDQVIGLFVLAAAIPMIVRLVALRQRAEVATA